MDGENDLEQAAEHEQPPEGVLRGRALSQALHDHAGDCLTPGGAVIEQSAAAVFQAIDTTQLTATFVILTDERNRQGNSHQIIPSKLGKGLRTDLGYEQAPVVLYDHGYSGIIFPVALSAKPGGKLDLRKSAKQAVATAFFPERIRDVLAQGLGDADEFIRSSASVFAGVAEGVLRMCSIGFHPLLAMLREQDAETQLPKGVERLRNWRGLHFTETELFEWSITPIGADRGALKQALDRGKIHDVRLPDWMRQSFEKAAGPDKVWAPGMTFRQSIGEARVTIEGPQEAVQQAAALLAPRENPTPRVDTPAPKATTPVIREPLIGAQQLAEAYEQVAKTAAPIGADWLAQQVQKEINLDALLAPLHQRLEQSEQELQRVTGKVAA